MKTKAPLGTKNLLEKNVLDRKMLKEGINSRRKTTLKENHPWGENKPLGVNQPRGETKTLGKNL